MNDSLEPFSSSRTIGVLRPEGCDRIALILQGEGVLNAYQGGAYCLSSPARHSLDRHIYFKELFRLQGELVKKSQIPYKEVTHQEVVLPPRIRNPDSRKRCTSRIGTEEFGASQPLAIHLTECGKQVPPR